MPERRGEREEHEMNILTFRESAPDLSEKDLLLHLLQFANGTKDRDILADNLLDHFGNLKAVLEARPEQLRSVKGVGVKTADYLSAFLPMVHVWHRLNMTEQQKVNNSREAENYCMSLCSGLRNEEFWVVCLNAQCKVIGKRRISTGSLSEVSAYPRMVMETALNYNAHSVLLTHNHPGGSCSPSPEDIASTVTLQRLLNGVGILVLDHIIVAGERTYSMIQHGDIDYRVRGR
jgi:DNA repair protein RadC